MCSGGSHCSGPPLISLSLALDRLLTLRSLSGGVQRRFARTENKAPVVLRQPLPHRPPPSPRILWAVAHLENLGLNSEGDRVGGEKRSRQQAQGTEERAGQGYSVSPFFKK